MGCFESRNKSKEVSNQNTEQPQTHEDVKIDIQNKQDLENNTPKDIQKQIVIEPSISIDDDNSSNQPMKHFDEQIRNAFLKKQAKPKIQKKNIHRDLSPKRNQEQKLTDLKRYSSQKCIEGYQISKNKLLHQKYRQINRNRMQNRINKHIQEQQQTNLQNNQIQINQQMIIEPLEEQEVAGQYSRKNSESQCSLLEIDIICYICQTKIQTNIFQPDCLHHYHQNCLYELITQQISKKQLQINCICNKVIPTKFIAFVLKQKVESDHQNSAQDYLETYFKNQYDFLTQNLF
ncbi:unnamed protein product (macronuclear) [Paramecium tetraurelia]|uniref:RING-type domain-containing protein n=1 Tax=Paramecium tetraurelia TaxID=5888 RepID=A0CLI4_PARTE|nr:uncharacterized protein GSPATT00008199001 [Paramecium tetraurelia]CAK71651.1 unnamed protein product [Paramecium tetraurelia]|eukprot:XP_001439048.1 hypothetical protein (macronuclear) [Paramecium tetraurelia strain d4-2]